MKKPILFLLIAWLGVGCKHPEPKLVITASSNLKEVIDTAESGPIERFIDDCEAHPGKCRSDTGFHIIMGAMTSFDRNGVTIDSMINDIGDTLGGSHYFRYGYNKVKQSGYDTLREVYVEDTYSSYVVSVFINGYRLKWYRVELIDKKPRSDSQYDYQVANKFNINP